MVRGDLRTYRIHLGSANDERLSLILSKAFLLADDTAITDGTILRQIRRSA